MLAISNTKKFLGFHDMLRCYDKESLVANLSFRIEWDCPDPKPARYKRQLPNNARILREWPRLS
jgi:hypothetical protein